MVYDKENDRIISSAGSDLEIYPTGPTFSESDGIVIQFEDESICLPSENIRELIDGLTQAADRLKI